MHVSKYAPQALKQTGLFQRLNRERRRWRLRSRMASARPLQVVIGAGPTEFPGWFQTDKGILDVTSPADWRALFEPESIDRLLSEHMLEHLTETEGRTAVKEAYRYLKKGGLFRVAVPDGNRRDAAYRAEVTPPRDGHQVLYNLDSLTALLESAGFIVSPLEYFDAREEFHASPWNENEGFIHRSIRFDSQSAFKRDHMYYTSLIVDARKI